MNHQYVKAALNLYAVLSNLEELVVHDREMTELVKDWEVSIQFSVLRGPKAWVQFNKGSCKVAAGKHPSPDVKLFFVSPAHLNKMMDGRSNPIPVKGFGRLKFLTKEFPKVTDRLEYYLKPDQERLRDDSYMAINTRFTLNTAVHALRELALHDDIGKLNYARMGQGKVVFKVMPNGPAAHIDFNGKDITVEKCDADKPMAVMLFRDNKVANDLLNGKSDAFAAVAFGDVMMKGKLGMIEPVNIILDRIPHYLS